MDAQFFDAERVISDAGSGSTLFTNTGKIFGRVLKRFFHLKKFNELFYRVMSRQVDMPFSDRILDGLDIRYDLSEMDRSRIPTQGPTIVVANHPFGAVEGLILGSVLLSVRPDVKVMANYLLRHVDIAELQKLFIHVNPFGGTGAVKSNIRPMKEAIELVRAGGMLGIFPAGEVSHLHLRRRAIVDPMWSETVARIIRKTKANVLPVFFEGTNSLLFHALGILHPRLRTILLPREMLNKQGKTVQIRVGRAIPFEKADKFADDRGMLEYMRFRTYMLRGRQAVSKPRFRGCRLQSPVAPPQPGDLVTREVRALPPEQMLVDTEEFAVIMANAGQIPHLLAEIGRLREITFRDANEGTGKSRDVDHFDEHYLHLFLWNKERNQIAGGYRLGLTDKILSLHGKDGLYTDTLFNLKIEFLERISPAIELGRSFVRPEYQKTYQPLMLLWKGIGRFIADNPHYKLLFGPVSISSDYHAISRELMVDFLKRNRHDADFARLVKARNPLKIRSIKKAAAGEAFNGVEDIQGLSELISDIEGDRKGVPILLKHYLKLGAQFLGFSIDRNFNDVVDALILVDLTNTDTRILERYMGKESAGAFLMHHCGESVEAAVCA